MKSNQHARSSSTRTDSGFAFLPEPESGTRSARTADAEFFGEEFVASALTGESVNEDVRDEVLEDEEGGFHVIGEDEMNPASGMADSTLDIDLEPSESRSGALLNEQAVRGGRWVAHRA